MKEKMLILRPLFFIFNLIFATWIVFQIEAVSPSDFGKYRSLFEGPPAFTPEKMGEKQFLKKVCSDYKKGKLDSTEVDLLLNRYLTAPKAVSAK